MKRTLFFPSLASRPACSAFTASLFFAVASCGGSSAAPPTQTPASAAAPATKAEVPKPAPSDAADAHVSGIPDKCADGQGEGICAPPKSFVQSLCGSYPKPDVALVMFSKTSPFTRVYMNRNMEAWYTSGQQSTSAKLVFDEEVVVLSHPKAASGGMVIGNGATNFDVLRLDGVCSSVEPEAVTTKRPPAPKYASVPWQQLEATVRETLMQEPSIGKADAARRKECKGTTSLGMLSPSCAKADDKLSATIAAYVTHSDSVPLPKSAH
ncbi:MAG TPA: hypothetical protein VGL13_12920 [Polyangiaceae bacterium]|jgi:hypothetical protein